MALLQCGSSMHLEPGSEERQPCRACRPLSLLGHAALTLARVHMWQGCKGCGGGLEIVGSLLALLPSFCLSAGFGSNITALRCAASGRHVVLGVILENDAVPHGATCWWVGGENGMKEGRGAARCSCAISKRPFVVRCLCPCSLVFLSSSVPGVLRAIVIP